MTNIRRVPVIFVGFPHLPGTTNCYKPILTTGYLFQPDYWPFLEIKNTVLPVTDICKQAKENKPQPLDHDHFMTKHIVWRMEVKQ